MASSGGGDAAAAAAGAAADAGARSFAELGHLWGDGAVRLVEWVHALSGAEYWAAILLTTIGLRLVMLVPTAWSMGNAARLTIARPEIERHKKLIESDARNRDPQFLKQYRKSMYELLRRHNVKPMGALIVPLIQV
ncbi:unnamed protein product, partial [Phaeothamnion confervicola]